MRATLPVLPQTPRSRLVLAVAGGIAAAYVLVLGKFLLGGLWIRDMAGHPLVVDFLPVYVSGQLAGKAQAAAAYDPLRLHQFEAAFVGHPFAGFLGWHYPPLFFLAAMALAALPYAVAFATWVVITALGYAGLIGVIARRPAACVLALALPPAFACALVGQNGFFTAAILGAMLLWLPRRPVLAGLLLALLTFKPQFGVLIPIALLGGGHYRALLTAALLTMLWIGMNLWLSPQSLAGFLHYLPQTSQAVLEMGTSGWGKLQSAFALVRLLGGGNTTAWAIQISAVLAMGGLCVWVWRQRDIAYELKAACLAACCLLATPYVYFYDLPLLALPLAFLYRAGAFDRTERIAIGAAIALLMSFFLVSTPVGLFAGLAILAITLRRIAGTRRLSGIAGGRQAKDLEFPQASLRVRC
jgi:arabinofuranan 3-O-arabinosyltransferase